MAAFAPEGGLALTLVRCAFVASLLSVSGTLAFAVLVAPHALVRADAGTAGRVRRVLARLSWAGLVAACVMLPAWLALQSADMAGAAGFQAAWRVAVGTRFGHVLLWQAAGLAGVAAALAVGRWRLATGLAALVTVLQAGHGHAAGDGFGPGLVAGAVHLVAAGAWLGGLLPLLAVVRVAPAPVGAAAARWFSPLGLWCVWLVAGSAAVQGWVLVGGLPGWMGTAYGRVALAKLVLFGVLVGFAWCNRHVFARRLLRPAPSATALRRSIAVQTGFGLLTVAAAGLLGSLPPAVHEPPDWPFPLRPTLVALSDADTRAEVIRGAAQLAAALALAVAGIVLRRRRWLAGTTGVAAVLLAGASTRHLDLLLVPANPASYLRSPTGFAAAGIVRGAELFAAHCAGCHGMDGRGDGPATAGLAVPAADLTAGHLWAHDDGEMFWWLTHGIDAPEGGPAMPGFADQLPPDARWALIDYVRARNAGAALRDTGAWPVPVPLPAATLSCADGSTRTTADLRGQVLHVTPVPPAVPQAGATPVTRRPAVPGGCATDDPALWSALAILAGAGVLVDAQGWLRAADLAGRWADPASLRADIAAAGRPIAGEPGHAHHE